MFKNYLSSIPYFEDKGYITSEFTFGFEFEGFINSRAFNAFEDLTKNTWYDRGVIKGSYATQHGKLKDDGSIEAHSDEYNSRCESCGGSGEIEDECESCHGSGRSFVCLECYGRGTTIEHCKHCDGTGENLFEKTCSACHGNGNSRMTCTECHGTGYIDQDTFFDMPKEKKDKYYKHWRETDLYGYRRAMEGGFKDGIIPRCEDCRGSGYRYTTCPDCGGDGNDGTYPKTFEFASPVLQVTPTYINDVIKYLQAAMRLGTQTNESCGFHIHIGFPDKTTSPFDINWTIMQLLVQDKMHLVSEFEGFEFKRYWANAERFDRFVTRGINDLRQKVKESQSKEALYNAIEHTFRQYTEHHKQDIVSQHSSGTLEWRGPTGFMDEGEIAKVRRFLKHFYKTVMTLSELCNTQTLNLGEGVTIKKYDYMVAMRQGWQKGSVSLAHEPERRKHMRMVDGKMQDASTVAKFISGTSKEKIVQFFKDYPFMRKIKFTQGYIAYNNYENVKNVVLSATIEDQNIVYSGDKALKIKSLNNISGTKFEGEPTKTKLVISSTHGTFAGCTFNNVKLDLAKVYNCEIQNAKLHDCIVKFDRSKISSSDIYSTEISGGNVKNSTLVGSEIEGTILHNCKLSKCVITIDHEENEIDPLETCAFDKCTFYFKRKNYATLAELKAGIDKETKSV